MRLRFIAGAAAVATLAGLAAPVAAQPGGVSTPCSIDQNNPKELAAQVFKLTQARSATGDQRRKLLSEIAKELDTKPERFAKNPAGYNSVLTQMLTIWGNEPTMVVTPVTRGQLGFVTNPAEPYDVMQELDKGFKAMAAAAPSCAEEIEGGRQNEVWLANVRAALDAQGAGKMDSAEYYAKRSMVMTGKNPYPHYVLANVANARNDQKGAVLHWGHVVQYAGTDTTYRDLKHNSQYYMGMTQLELAAAANGAEQQQLAKEAAATLKTVMEEQPENPDAANIMRARADALTFAKDTAAIPAVYAPLLAAPEKHPDLLLTMAGVIATQLNRSDDALKLFEGAAAQNVAARDALRNVAATYYGKDNFTKMFEPTRKLVEIDPNNYEAWMLFAYASQGMARGAKVAAEKKAWTDSLVKYQTYADGLPVKVDVATFTRGKDNVSLQLTLEQVAAAGGTHTVEVEFVDAKGGVIAKATESSGPMKAGEKKSVTLKATGTNIAGFRYKALK